MDRQALLVKSREITLSGGWGEKGKEDRKQNTLAPLTWGYQNCKVLKYSKTTTTEERGERICIG
jgi:hypothetical protein